MTLEDLKPGQEGTVISVGEKGPARRRIMDMGVTPGATIKVIKVAPLGDPIEVNIRGYELSLRKEEAKQIQVQ
ncbi:MAG: iron transporter FeoA [Clostridiales bacterium]|jgi:ferrous iron transport protein A|nr:iron transporter FeoA [Clostridiales bacterium]